MPPIKTPGSSQPPRSGPPLELLVRKPASTKGFVLHQLESGSVLLRMRPRRKPDVVMEERQEEDGSSVIFLPATGAYLRFSAEERAILDLMDGKSSMQELATVWFMRFGSFNPDRIFGLLTHARKAGLLEVQQSRFFRLPLPDQSRFEQRWGDVDTGFQRLLGWAQSVLNRWTALPFALTILGGLIWFFTTPLPLPPLPWWVWGLAGIGGWALGTLPHEAAHGLACAAFGRRIRAVGIGIRGAWVDTTDMFLSGRIPHALVALAGPAASLSLASISSLLAHLLPYQSLQTGLILLCYTLLLQTFVTLWPVLGVSNDGFHALCDFLREARLDRDSWSALRHGRPRPVHLLWIVGVLCTWIVLTASAIEGLCSL